MFDISFLTGENINNSNAYSLSSSTLNMDVAFGDSISKGLKGETGVFFDALYGDFNYDFSKTANSIQNDNQTNTFYKLS